MAWNNNIPTFLNGFFGNCCMHEITEKGRRYNVVEYEMFHVFLFFFEKDLPPLLLTDRVTFNTVAKLKHFD